MYVQVGQRWSWNGTLTSPGVDGIRKQVGFNSAPTKCLQWEEELDGFVQWFLHLHTWKEREKGERENMIFSRGFV